MESFTFKQFYVVVLYMKSLGLDHNNVRKVKQKPTVCMAICMMALFDCNYQNL